MTALNQQMFDKVNEVFIIIAQKISTFLHDPNFDGPPLLIALTKLQKDAKSYQDLLSEDKIETLPDEIPVIQAKLDSLKEVILENLLDNIDNWDTFLVAQASLENPENDDPNA